jgi:hypothetical protein
MKLTNEQLKRIIKEELEAVLNEGSLAYVKQQLGTAGRHNPWLKSFGSLQYLSGPENSLTNWISQAESSNDREAKEALNKVRQLMRQYKQSEMAETTLAEGEDLSRQKAFTDLRMLPYGKLIQNRIQELYNEKNTAELGEMQNYAATMSVTKDGKRTWTGYNPLVGVPKDIAISRINNEKSPEAENYRRAVTKAIQSARDLLNQKSSSTTAGEEKPGVMDRIKGFFKEE